MANVAFPVEVRVGIYARISSDRDGDELGVTRQRRACEQLAAARGWRVADCYIDDDISAWSGKRRPQYERMLADLRAGVIRGVVVWHLDRLHRHPRELEDFIVLCDELGVVLGCVTGDVDIGTHMGRLSARMLGILARYESDHKSERILSKHDELAQAGKISGGGSRPYGYETDKRTVRPAEAAIVREATTRFLAGESLRSIAVDLNRRGISAAGGGAWSLQSLRRMLGSARIAGLRAHRGEVVATAEWPGITTPDQHRQVRALLADPARRTSGAVRRYLLAGILVCSRCGERLVARPRAGGQRRYHCARGPGFSGCGKTAIKADDVEAYVVEAVLHRIDDPQVKAAQERRPKEPDAQRWQEQLEADREQLAELAALWARREVTSIEWRVAKEPIQQRITQALKQLQSATRARTLDPFLGNGEELRAQWASLDLSQQHAIVSQVVDHVVVGPGRPGYNRFDPSRLQAVWIP